MPVLNDLTGAPIGVSGNPLHTTGDVSLSSSTLTDIETIIAENQTGLTDSELRAAPVPMSFTRLSSGTDTVSTVQIGTWNFNLPTNAATESTLSSVYTRLATFDGVTSKTLNTQLVSTDKAVTTSSVIHGLSTGGGGAYVDVKVNPSGSLVVDTGLDQPLTDTELRAAPVEVSSTEIVDITTSLGTDGASPPTIVGTGVRGWLRSLYDRIIEVIGGTSQFATREYGISAGYGQIAGTSFITMQGYNETTGTVNELIWASSGATYPNITTATTLTLSSSSTLDTGAGTGARTVLVSYVRFSDGVEVVAPFTLNGQTAVTITTDGYAINGVRVLTAGTTGSNQGTLYVGFGTLTLGVPLATNTLATVPANKNKAQQAIYTVPAGKIFSLASYRIATSVLSYVQLRTKTGNTGIQVVEFDIPLNGIASFNSVAPSNFTAGTQIQLWARTTAGAGAAGILVSGFLRNA